MKYNFVDLASFMGGAYAAASPAFVTKRPSMEEAAGLFPDKILPRETHVFWDLEPAEVGADHVILVDEGLRGSPLLSFILAHEKGHIDRGHLETPPSEDEIVTLENGTRVMNSAIREIEADAWAFRELGIATPERRVAMLMAVFRQALISQGIQPEWVTSKSNEELQRRLSEAEPELGARLTAARNMVW